MFMVHAAARGHVAVHSPCYSQDHVNVGGQLQAELMPMDHVAIKDPWLVLHAGGHVMVHDPCCQ